MLSFVALALLATLSPSLAAVNPTSPDSSTVVKVGDDITALWTADTTGQWTNMEIQLMTGGNLQMVPLAVLGQNIDGTTLTSFSVPAPDVSPYSQIYFLQFTQAGDVSTALWSTRFTIAGQDGSTTEPTNTTNWNGQDVKWGTGVLLGSVSSPSSSNSSTSMGMGMADSAPSSSSTGGLNAVASPSGSTSASRSSESVSPSASRSGAAETSGAASKNMAVGGGAMILALAGWLL